MYIRSVIFLCSLLSCLHARSQTKPIKEPGMFSLGMRSTMSLFGEESRSAAGTGVGGHFRIQFSNRVNSEWYADYITTNINDLAIRKDYHVGWSLYYYYLKHNATSTKVWQPFIEAGHCFDYTDIEVRQTGQSADRFSSAVQTGLGTHINLTPRFDVTVKSQYMIHLGSDIHTHIENDVVEIEKHDGFSLEGHWLFTVSVTYKIGNLW